jgi:GNAT superfamily N-acetyltransferase
MDEVQIACQAARDTTAFKSMNQISLRFATPDDAEEIFKLVLALARYERLEHEVYTSPDHFRKVLADAHSGVEVLLAESETIVIGFALYFRNYSTFVGKPGLFLEDLFVLPEHRKSGIGTALLQRLIQIARERNCGRVEWHVLDWNRPAIDFYTQKIGAELIESWRICRVDCSREDNGA